MSNQIHYYVHGHTGKGFIDLLASNLQGIDHIYLLENNDKKHVSDYLSMMATMLKNEEIEIINSTISTKLIDGIINRKSSVAILHAPLYHSKNDGKKVGKITISGNEVKEIPGNNNHEIYHEAYNYFKKGLAIHDKLEKIYIKKMDFNKANKIIENLLEQLFKDVEKTDKNSTIYERFFGTNTPEGIVNTVPSLIEPIANKIFILGRAGTGKSYVMNQVLNKCIEYGFDIEIYRCSLDPKSIDMLIIRELNACLHDNTPPHTVDTGDPSIQIIDMYKETVDQSVEKVFGERIRLLQKKYKEQMQLGLKSLKKIKIH